MNAIKYLLIAIISIFSIACNSSAYPSPVVNGVYSIDHETTLSLVGDITGGAVQKFIKDLGAVKTPNKTLTIYVASGGGSVIDGNQMIDQVRAHKRARGLRTVCLVQEAASMAFAFVQGACDVRVVSETSVLMQHQISFGAVGPIEKISSTLALGRSLERQLNAMQAKRLGMSVEEFRTRIAHDWFLLGQEAIDARAADSIGLWLCLNREQCPLLPPQQPEPAP